MAYISSATTVAYIDPTNGKSIVDGYKVVYLPSSFNIEGKAITIKDSSGRAKNSNIWISTLGGDKFQGGNIFNNIINTNYGFNTFVAHNGIWYTIGQQSVDSSTGISSLSSIVSYGLSSLFTSIESIGGPTSSWAQYPAIQDINLQNNNIINTGNIDKSIITIIF